MHIKNLLDLFLEKNNAGNPFGSLNFVFGCSLMSFYLTNA